MDLSNLEEHIVTLAKIYCRHENVYRKLSLSSLSLNIFNHGNRLKNVVDGNSSLTLKSYSKAMEWFSNNWPSGLSWPDDIPRQNISSKNSSRRLRQSKKNRQQSK